MIGTDAVVLAAAVRNLGLYMDNDLSMQALITSLLKACFSILRQLKSVSRSLPRNTTRRLVQCFFSSHIDYCNVAFSGLPKHQFDHLQSVINASVSLVARVRKYDHSCPPRRTSRTENPRMNSVQTVSSGLQMPAQSGSILSTATHHSTGRRSVLSTTAIVEMC